MEAALNGPTGRIILGPVPLTIGRMPGSQLLLTDSQSSGYHAEIRQEGQGYSIIDLGSTNGTFVNEQKLIPHASCLLVSGNRVRIGGTVFTYEADGQVPIAPTVYASPPGNPAAFEPTVAVPPPVAYDANAQQPYPPAPLPPIPPGFLAYPVLILQPQYAPPGAPASSPVAPIKKKSRRGLWIVLSSIAVLLVACCAFGAVVIASRSTPTKTLTTFCNDLKTGNYHDAYQQLSSSAQHVQSEAIFTQTLQQGLGRAGGLKDCSFSGESDNGSMGTFLMTWTVNQSLVPPVNFDGQLVNEGGVWKINQLRSNLKP
jgi:predicted component of type VI protein secretion system